jgi:hypothetical protein
MVWGWKEMGETCRKNAVGSKDSRLLRRPEMERYVLEKEH